MGRCGFSLPIGFNFTLYGHQNDTLLFSQSYVLTNTTMVTTLAAPMYEDLCDRAFDPSTDNEGDPGGISDISYTVTGTIGSRICIIQVSNAGFFGEIAANTGTLSEVNLQLWLYEGSNNIEFRFGTVNIQNPSDNLTNPNGFLCGLAENIDLNTAGCLSSNVLNGLHSSPTMVEISQSLSEVIAGAIQSGRVYKFTRFVIDPVGIAQQENKKQFVLFPNPASNTIYYNGEFETFTNGQIYFYALDGRLISTKKLLPATDISELSKGIYLVKVLSNANESLYSGKLVIVE